MYLFGVVSLFFNENCLVSKLFCIKGMRDKLFIIFINYLLRKLRIFLKYKFILILLILLMLFLLLEKCEMDLIIFYLKGQQNYIFIY